VLALPSSNFFVMHLGDILLAILLFLRELLNQIILKSHHNRLSFNQYCWRNASCSYMKMIWWSDNLVRWFFLKILHPIIYDYVRHDSFFSNLLQLRRKFKSFASIFEETGTKLTIMQFACTSCIAPILIVNLNILAGFALIVYFRRKLFFNCLKLFCVIYVGVIRWMQLEIRRVNLYTSFFPRILFKQFSVPMIRDLSHYSRADAWL
jgi:hypothetical protein